MPAAPPLFSTTTVWPHLAPSFCATMRAPVSVPPPGGKGTTRVTARFGYVPCANTAAVAASSAAAVRRLFMAGLGLSAVERRALRVEGPVGVQVLHRRRVVARTEAVLQVELVRLLDLDHVELDAEARL